MIKLLVFAFDQVHVLYKYMNVKFFKVSQTRKAAEPIVAAVLQGLMWMVLLQSYHLPKTSQSATATKGARPILL